MGKKFHIHAVVILKINQISATDFVYLLSNTNVNLVIFASLCPFDVSVKVLLSNYFCLGRVVIVAVS